MRQLTGVSFWRRHNGLLHWVPLGDDKSLCGLSIESSMSVFSDKDACVVCFDMLSEKVRLDNDQPLA